MRQKPTQPRTGPGAPTNTCRNRDKSAYRASIGHQTAISELIAITHEPYEAGRAGE